MTQSRKIKRDQTPFDLIRVIRGVAPAKVLGGWSASFWGGKDIVVRFFGPAGLRMTALLLVVYATPALAWTGKEAAQFQKANESYRAGKFAEAASIYQGLSQTHHEISAIFYNLANSLYRQGSVGPAILAYERARMIEPRDRDILYNLSYARSLLEYRVEDKRNWYLRVVEKVLEYFTEKEIYLLAITAYFLLMASWAFVLFFRRGLPWGWGRKTLLTVFLLSLMLAAAKHLESRVIRDGVVVAKSAEVRYGPSADDQIAFRLGEGLRVYVLERRMDWSRILLVNGETGWVSNDQISEMLSAPYGAEDASVLASDGGKVGVSS